MTTKNNSKLIEVALIHGTTQLLHLKGPLRHCWRIRIPKRRLLKGTAGNLSMKLNYLSTTVTGELSPHTLSTMELLCSQQKQEKIVFDLFIYFCWFFSTFNINSSAAGTAVQFSSCLTTIQWIYLLTFYNITFAREGGREKYSNIEFLCMIFYFSFLNSHFSSILNLLF